VFCGGLRLLLPAMGPAEMVLAGLSPVLAAGWLMQCRMRRESRQRESLIREQIAFVESRHEELREAYLGQEQTQVELRRKVTQLTALHQAGLLFSATLDETRCLSVFWKRSRTICIRPCHGVDVRSVASCHSACARDRSFG